MSDKEIIAALRAELADYQGALSKCMEAVTLVTQINNAAFAERAELFTRRASNDLHMLRYLMQGFDSEVWNCERCGHAEPTKDMDSADLLRTYLTGQCSPPKAIYDIVIEKAAMVDDLQDLLGGPWESIYARVALLKEHSV